jgi:hypothetical protein
VGRVRLRLRARPGRARPGPRAGDGADFLRALLPEPFHEAACAWQATSQAGLRPGLRYRLWFVLSRPLLGRELAAWCERPEVDPCVFRPAEPIYTAAPVFDGRHDPVPRRVGLLGGLEPAVPVPTGCRAGPLAAPAPGRDASRPARGFEGWLARVGDGEGLAGFRGPVLSALACYARRHGPDALAAPARRSRPAVRARIAEAPKGPGRGDDLAATAPTRTSTR